MVIRTWCELPHDQVTVIVVLAELLPQLTVIGQVPRVVVAPTFQVQLTFPAGSEVFGVRPAAVEVPEE
jgi:hypothetical protein